MARDNARLLRSLRRFFAREEDLRIVLDRRKGDRRRRVQATGVERRKGERRRPLIVDVGEIHNFFGERTHLRGELNFGGTVRMDGHFEGQCVRGETLIIGEHGLVSADIQVEILQVSGKVQGNITAKRWVEFFETSQVTGTVRTPRLTIWKGSVFKGKCEMPRSGRDVGGGRP